MLFTGTARAPLLGVNIDHVATLRNARGGRFPDPVAAATLAVEAGADIITFHLREDRRHIKDDDVTRLKSAIHVPLNFEAAVTDEMLSIIERTKPEHVCLVPERRQEVTTEGGLDVSGQLARVTDACTRLREAGCRVSLFIEADPAQIAASAQIGAHVVELHTGAYCDAFRAGEFDRAGTILQRLQTGARQAGELGLEVHAGHGIDFATVKPVAAIPGLTELNIGHFLIGEAIFTGLAPAIQRMRALMDAARAEIAA